MNILQRIEWRLYKERKRLKLKNKTPSIISSNCNAGIIYHDMGLRFFSPTINLSFEMNDFVRMLQNLRWYMEQPVTPCEDNRFDFPVGKIGDIEIRFNHYKSFEEACNKWEERKKRIDWDNLYIMAIDGDNCSYESLKTFDSLPFVNKVVFTHRPYPEIKSSFYIHGFENDEGIGPVIYFKRQFFVRRYLDDFDYVAFLNKNKI